MIYRCTYESDTDWSDLMTRLRYQTRAALEFYNGLDMLDSLDITVFEDRVSLDGASKSAVREQFKNSGAPGADSRKQLRTTYDTLKHTSEQSSRF